MEEGKLLLLVQLVNSLESNFVNFQKSYDKSDKEAFDFSKSAILEIQKKIEGLIK